VRDRSSFLRAYLASPRGRTTSAGRFIIITSGRTGSELLVSLLASHPQIECDSEIFGTKRLLPDHLIAGRVARAVRHGRIAYGFKLKPTDIFGVQQLASPWEWVRTLHEQGWQVIRLSRTNRLHQAISVAHGDARNWHYSNAALSSFEPMVINPLVLIATMCAIDIYEEQIDVLLKGVEHLELVYEDDLLRPEDQERSVTSVCRMLEIDPWPTSSTLIRITPEHTRELVANYDEIADVIRSNRFARYLVE
jgi:LPS sulfotransferase NodH